jgi:oxygen-independent coproporphyrinogen-3 oxidase
MNSHFLLAKNTLQRKDKKTNKNKTPFKSHIKKSIFATILINKFQLLAGLYIHIPFCKQACHYCNFHFATSSTYKSAVIDAICKEIELRKNFFDGKKTLETVYFGGGTPSLLDEKDLDKIWTSIGLNFNVEKNAEITFEANPDDLNIDYLKKLKNTPINRLSIGIQSFLDADLYYMNRAHSALEAEKCIDDSLEIGFENISIDLIYGTPTLNDRDWERNLEKVFSKNINHISAYALTQEPKTPLDKMIKIGKMAAPNDHKMEHQFKILLQQIKTHGFLQYEISNFAKPNSLAIHNTNYWKNKAYLGIGPSAHSYNLKNRQINISNNQKYIQAISENKQYIFTERLSLDDKYNEFVMTRLRTMWGINKNELVNEFGSDYKFYFEEEIKPFLEKKWVVENNGNIVLHDEGKLFADKIAATLFKI